MKTKRVNFFKTQSIVIIVACTVHSVDVMGEKYWLVLRNYESSTDSYWDDGSSSTYRRWASGAPVADTEKTCVLYDEGGLFRDKSCTETERYTCKMATQPARKPHVSFLLQYSNHICLELVLFMFLLKFKIHVFLCFYMF